MRVEFGQTLLGESGKIETSKETKTADYNYTTSLECTFDEPYSFDGICQKPIVGMVKLFLSILLVNSFSPRPAKTA